MYRLRALLPRVAGVLLIWLAGSPGLAIAGPISRYIDDPIEPVRPSPEEPAPAAPAGIAVGRSPGHATVSPGGEAQYSIPLDLPPGTNRLTPRLSLEYRHTVAGGMLGAGWTVGGLSSISRCRRTIALDGVAGPVTQSPSDRFCLDGHRLVVVNGVAYGSAGGEYRTEIDSLARIRSYGTAGAGPQYFLVEAADGLLHEYGATADSRIDWSGKAWTPRAWALNQVRDRAGNTIDFRYTEDAATGSFRIASVRYNGNPSQGIAPTHELAFSYENRPAQESDLSYVAGSPIRQMVRLARIDLLYNGSVLKRHELDYEPLLSTAGRSRLASLRECGVGAAECLASTVLGWQDGRPGLGQETSHPVTIGGKAWIAEPKRWWAADVNGDGRDDLVWAGGSLDAATVHFRLAVATGGYGAEIDTGIAAPNGVGVPLDYDGDGARDALLVSAAGRWQVVLGGANGLGGTVETGITATDGDFRGVDLNGDGLSDLAYTEMVGTSGNLLQVRARYNKPGLGFSGSPVVLYEQGYSAGYDYAEGGEFLGRPGQRIDLDGDGREDLLMNENYSLARISADERMSEPFASAISGAVPADINGDGCTDIAYPHYQGSWRIRFSGCLVSGPYGLEIAGPAYGALRHAIAVIDWNADRKDDLLYGDASSTWKVVQSAGDSLLPAMDTGVAHGSPSTVVVADLDGDGLQDLATRAGPRLSYRLHEGPVPDLLLSVADGFGVETRFDYAVATDPKIHTKYSGAVYPQRDLQDARTVVSRLSVSDGSGLDSMAVTSYTYAGLRSDVTGRGDLGFARRVATQLAPSPGMVFEDEYRQDHPYAGRSARHIVKLSNGRAVRETSRDWATLTHGSGYAARHFPYVSSSRETRFDPYRGAGGEAHTTISVSANSIDSISGLVTDARIIVTEGAGGENPGATRTERIQHELILNDTTHWCLGRPGTTRVTAQHSLPGGDPVTRSGSQAWDTMACRLTRQQSQPGDPRWQVTTDLAYDAFGNNSRRTITGAGMAPRATIVAWGTRGRFPIALTNPLYETTVVSWEEGAGLPVALTDTNGLTTRWTYDTFGRLLRETRPDGTRATWSRAKCGAECDSRARYSLRRDEQDAAGSDTGSMLAEFDRFDRSLRVATRRAGGAYAEEAVNFDSHGRVASRSVPYWSGGLSPAGWHYDYDGLGRLTVASLRSASGSVERSLSYEYDALNAKSADALGGQSTRRWTAWGDLVSVTDALGGTSRYQHGAFGELLRVDDALGNTTSKIAYNIRGMKTGHFDMDLGAWSIVPNALGEVVAWTDAKAQTTTVSYDLLGRPISRVEAEGMTRWTWGASRAARNVGRLAAVSSPGYSESYIYDSLARLASRRISSDAIYEFSYAYDAAGQLKTLTYPVSAAGYRLQVGYEYEQGQPVRIVDRSAPGTAFWQLGATDAAGNVIDETLGAAVRVVSGFSPLTGLIEYRWASAGGAAPAQDLSYRWDAMGNLLERRDRSRNLSETFGYDAENRLDATTLNGATGVSLGYDLLGNILWKSDVCPTASPCYSYDGSRRHAVTKAGSNSYGYDANGNMTSRNGSSIAWYSYNLPRTLAAAGGNLSQFWYGPLRNRWKQVATGAGTNETTIYVGGLVEKVMRDGATVWRHYVQGPAGTTAIHLRYGDGSPARTYHPTHDHLGGTDRIVDGTTGVPIVSESFDAFGRRRGNDGTMYPTISDWAAIRSTTRDGFTGHEHLDNLGLVHMNGRVYDPVIARFLSADPVVQDPTYGQDLNRYSYAWNNPLSVIDPSGLEEVRCLHGPDGGCQGVTVTGLRKGHGMSGFSPAYQLWRSGSNGQAASAAQRDPCGQDGSAMACAGAGRREAAGSAPPAVAPGQADWRSLESWSGLGRASLNLLPGWYYAGQALAALKSGDYLDASLFYGATVGDVFLLGRGFMMGQAGRAVLAEARIARGVAYGPLNPGPLAEEIAGTFRSGTYRARRLDAPLAVYRVTGVRGNPVGRFWTTSEPRGPLQSVVDLAIDQNWRNPATQVIRAEIPAGTLIYEGATAPQRGLVGGMEQIYIPRVDARWLR